MGAMLPPGTRFRSADRRNQGSIVSLLGEGGQGAVYKVEYANRTLALKWYHEPYLRADRTLRSRLGRAIDRGAPDNRFLWPMELVYIEGSPSFGYLMPLRSTACVGMAALLAPAEERLVLNLRRRLKLCLNIARSFFALHARGFCYQDINFGNIFLFERTAEVLICDNDNVNIDGADASIYGTRKFMAPEVVRRESLPNTRTDLYSMAVLFHYILMGWHPLEGAREHAIELMRPDDEMRIYGSQPLFMFSARDAANGPVLPYHAPIVRRWNALSEDLRNLFRKSFDQGLSDPYARVIESEWIAAFEAVEHADLECPACQYEHVYEPDAGRPDAARACVHCGAALPRRALLKVGRKLCLLAHDRVIPKSLHAESSAKSWESFGVVARHPTQEDALGIRNTSEAPWTVFAPGSPGIPVGPGSTVRVIEGLSIDFGPVTGSIVN